MKNLLLALLCISCLSSCDLFGDKIDRAVNTIDKAVAKMNTANADWQSIIRNLQKDIPDDVRGIIGNDVNALVHDGIGAAGAETKCNLDFVKDRVKNSLLNIKARLLNKPLNLLPPGFCTLNMAAINLNARPESRRLLNIYGYDLNYADTTGRLIQIAMIGKDTIKFVDEAFIGRATNYQLTVSLNALLPTLIDNTFDKLQLYWNGDAKGMPQIVIQKWIAKTKVVEFSPTPMTFVPPFSGGRADRDFDTEDGNPTVGEIKIEYRADKDKVEARVYMDAMEFGGDNTRVGVSIDPATNQPTGATAWGPWTRIYTNTDPQWEIKQFSSDIAAYLPLNITSKGPKLYSMGGGSVAFYTVDLDQIGDEAGSYTKVTVDWNKLSVVLIEKKPTQ